MISRVIFIRPWEAKKYGNPKKVRKHKERKKKKKTLRVWGFKFPQKSSSLVSQATRFVKHLGAKVSKAFSRSKGKRSSRKISSASTLLAADSQRAEAIEDCIEFLNSCSSLPRSSSVSSSVNYYY